MGHERRLSYGTLNPDVPAMLKRAHLQTRPPTRSHAQQPPPLGAGDPGEVRPAALPGGYHLPPEGIRAIARDLPIDPARIAQLPQKICPAH